MSRDLSNRKIILRIFVFAIFISFIPSNIFGNEKCSEENLKARLNYDSGVFWAGRGEYQKSYNLLSDALKICPDYNDAIIKHKEIEKLLQKQKESEVFEMAKKLKAQKESEERRRYKEHLRSERERVFREAKEKEKIKNDSDKIESSLNESPPKCTQDKMWKFVVNNAYRTADEYAMQRNRYSTFISFDEDYTFTKHYQGEFTGKYLMKITNMHGNKISIATLLPLFDVDQSSEGLDDQKPLWKVIDARLNGIPY